MEDPAWESGKFHLDKVRGYPCSKKKVSISVMKFSVRLFQSQCDYQKTHSIHISPYGIDFQLCADFCEGDLLKIDVRIPNYWNRKKYFISYNRVNVPKSFQLIARVVEKKNTKGRKKNLFAVETLSIDDTDAQVLRSYLLENTKSSINAA